MKKILIVLLLLLFGSCATTQQKLKHRYSNVSLEGIQNSCDTDNRWWMHLGGYSVVVLQFDNCLGVDNMLVMIAPADKFTHEIRSASYNLLGLHYLEFLNTTKSDRLWSLKMIKDFLVPADAAREQPGKWIVIYKINSKVLDCSGESCKKDR